MVTRKEYAGAAAATYITSAITAGATTILVADGSTLPTGASYPFVVVIDRGTANEEKILVLSRTSNTLTVSSRGYDGTTAVAHAINAALEHCVDAASLDEANKAAAQTIGKVTSAGDLLYGTGSEALARLPIGSALQTLLTNAAATAPEWAASLQSLLTAAGDIVYASSANTPARLAKGTARQQLAMNSGATAPEWVASLQSLLTAAGDIVYASSANTPARLAKGSDGQVLTLASGLPSWASPASAVPANDSATVAAAESTTSDAFTDLATSGPAVTVVTGTKALVIVSAQLYSDTAGKGAAMAFAVSGATTRAAAAVESLINRNTGSALVSMSRAFIVTGLSAGSNTFTAKYKRFDSGGTASFVDRNITVVDMGS